MERTPPNRRRVVFALRAVILLALAGCSNQQMSASNPFMAPDRVPPPATRTIAPGTAAPYYPGDPVPAAQNIPPSPTMVAQAQPPVAPAGIAPAAMASALQAPPNAPAAASTPQSLAFSNERTVAVPQDNDALRFPLPAPPSVPPAGPPPLAASQVAAAPAPAQQVVPAAFNSPVASQPMAAATPVPSASVPSATDTSDSGGPWRTPQVPNSGSPVMQAQYVQPQAAQPTMLVAQQPQPTVPAMPVQLQSVPTPNTVPTTVPAAPVDPTLSPPPRMRFPSWTEPSTWFTPQPAASTPPPGSQLIGYMVPGPNGQQQMVSVEQYQAMTTGAAQAPASVASTSDGFRARGSVTK